MNDIAGVIDMLVAPLAYPFMVRGLLAATIVGIVCSVVGSYVMLRGMAFLGSALSHAILPGVAMGYIVSGGSRAGMFWWALATAIVTAIGIGTISKEANVKEDTAISIVFAAMFALGIGIISTMRGYAVDLAHMLFGNVLGVTTDDLWRVFLFGLLVLLTIAAFYKEFLVISFDPTLAKTLRLPVTFFHYLLLLLIAVTIVVSLQTVGIALMLAILITPAATAYQLTQRLPVLMAIAAIIGAASGIVGMYLSYYVHIASGPAIVLVCTACFLVTMLFAPHRGWVWRLWRDTKAT